MKFNNGNVEIQFQPDGTRIMTYDNDLRLEWPLNIDIRITNRCSFGYNPATNKAFCSFCHESARTDGQECDYGELKQVLNGLPPGTELAIGGNEVTTGLIDFLHWAKYQGYFCNLTVNQGHVKRDEPYLKTLIENDMIKGLGISFRKTLKWNVPEWLLKNENTVFHVIAGIDTVEDVLRLATFGVKKILILGEKDFGFNQGKVNLESYSHKQWRWIVRKMFDEFEVVSFDNLALEQLNIKRFIPNDDYETFHQGEHSLYINAVEKYFAPSSRSSLNKKMFNQITLNQYFKENELC